MIEIRSDTNTVHSRSCLYYIHYYTSDFFWVHPNTIIDWVLCIWWLHEIILLGGATPKSTDSNSVHTVLAITIIGEMSPHTTKFLFWNEKRILCAIWSSLRRDTHTLRHPKTDCNFCCCCCCWTERFDVYRFHISSISSSISICTH